MVARSTKGVPHMKRNITPIVAVLAIVAALGLVGAMDAEDAEAQAALYCDNVKSGLWPDYEGTYAKVCEAEYGKPKKFTNSSI